MLTPKNSEINSLFHAVKTILDHQEQLEKLKGERFNIFSILKMEQKENATHSAFLAELLNPAGSHLKGNIFLQLFLNSITQKHPIEISTAKVTTEFHIGERNDVAKEGGRIDIYITDNNGYSISIENKIYAGDQYAQVERYYNHNKEKNTELYLTLDGKEPSVESKGTLEAGTDFQLLSYRDNISAWLGLCLKEATDSPMLRESIKQYINLINKMTSTPDNQHEKELVQTLRNNYSTAIYVKNNLNKARLAIAQELREMVVAELKQKLPAYFEVGQGVPIDKKYAQVWIWHKEFPNAYLYFGIEPFNGDGRNGGNMFVGVHNFNATENEYTLANNNHGDLIWYHQEYLKIEEGFINFNNEQTIIQVQESFEFKQKLIGEIVNQSIAFVLKHDNEILSQLENQKVK